MYYVRVATNMHDDTIYSGEERHVSINLTMYYCRDVITVLYMMVYADGLRCEIEVVT